jgi:hypothetical protein
VKEKTLAAYRVAAGDGLMKHWFQVPVPVLVAPTAKLASPGQTRKVLGGSRTCSLVGWEKGLYRRLRAEMAKEVAPLVLGRICECATSLDGPPEATANQLTTKLLQAVGGTIDKDGAFWINQCEKLRDPRYVEETIRTAKSKKRQMKQISIERVCEPWLVPWCTRLAAPRLHRPGVSGGWELGSG